VYGWLSVACGNKHYCCRQDILRSLLALTFLPDSPEAAIGIDKSVSKQHITNLKSHKFSYFAGAYSFETTSSSQTLPVLPDKARPFVARVGAHVASAIFNRPGSSIN
jgi:hypothetical protein